ncbi:MAG: UbiA family prenyltransferase [Deltaproteobacteria bacterium]|nr:UbiA family prenyltransferase [Deltaproteobacteria bacterium]
MFSVRAGARIATASFAYRVKKREANNLAVTASMLLAFGLPWPDLLFRGLFALILNMYVYLINDVCDIQVDLASPGKDQDKTAFMASHRSAALFALAVEGALLAAAAALHAWFFSSWLLPIAFFANTLIIGAYSQWLKHIPFVDVAIMAVAGASTTMVGVPNTPRGWKLLGILAILSSSYQVIQVIRDSQVDTELDVHTTAVILGPSRAAWLFRFIVMGAAAYGFFALGSIAALAFILGVFFPLDVARAERTWDYARLLFGMVWLALVVQIYLGQI